MMDNYDAFEAYDRKCEQWRESRPRCVSCGEHIQDEYSYDTPRGCMCEECARAYAEELSEEFMRDTMEDWKSYIDERLI